MGSLRAQGVERGRWRKPILRDPEMQGLGSERLKNIVESEGVCVWWFGGVWGCVEDVEQPQG